MPNTKILMPILAAVLLANTGVVYAIAKCQDADGKWHYGDSAASACGTTKITIIDNTGRKIEEIGEPMTIEEINAKAAEEKRIKQEEKQQTKRELEKKRILAIYPSEDSVLRARDDRLKGMDKNLKLQSDLFETMQLDLRALRAKPVPTNEKAKIKFEERLDAQQENVDDYYRVITQLRREREQTDEKYKKILKEFRELTAE